MITRYIKDLLFEQDCVVIPDFGGFIANYVSAEIHPIRHTFSPPSKSIAFNEMLRLNDGLLASYVAQHEGISREEALNRIKEYTTQLWNELRQKNKYRLEEVGTLFLNGEQKLQFEPENRINFLNESFGLPELLYQPVERSVSQRSTGAFSLRNANPVKTKDRPAMSNEEVFEEEEPFSGKSTSQASRLWLFVAVPMVLLLAATTGLFLFFDDGNTVLSSFNPFTALYSQRKSEGAPVDNTVADAAPTEATPKNESAPESSAPVNEPAGESENWNTTPTEAVTASSENQPEVSPEVSKEPVSASIENVSESYIAIATEVPRYYVIIGSFSKNRNAIKLRKKLVAKGFAESKVIVPKVESNLHKVSFADYATFQEASDKLEQLRPEYGNELWVFKYVK
jgi:hypothetical protein